MTEKTKCVCTKSEAVLAGVWCLTCKAPLPPKLPKVPKRPAR